MRHSFESLIQITPDLVSMNWESRIDISWNPLLFQRLAIPSKQKKLIQALAASHMSRDNRCPFDDFVAGKGHGLIMLLQ